MRKSETGVIGFCPLDGLYLLCWYISSYLRQVTVDLFLDLSEIKGEIMYDLESYEDFSFCLITYLKEAASAAFVGERLINIIGDFIFI